LGGLFVFWRTIPKAREVNSGARGLDFGKVLAESWAYGRWLAGASLLGIAGGQLQTVAAAFAGLEAAAGLRAAQNFVLPMSQVITATATLGLPALSADFGRGERQRMLRKGRVITFGLTALALLYGLCLFLLRVPLESIVYGGRYAEYTGVIALMLTVPVFTAASTGYSLILRAGQWPEHYLIATAVSAAVGIPTALGFASRWGVWGAALSVSLTYLAGALASYWLYRMWVAKESRPLGAARDLTGPARKSEVVTGAREGIDDEGKSP
ncbi:MAG: lipopolysaccharide biosynthesis protein, partial [Anaerolineales bacterium]